MHGRHPAARCRRPPMRAAGLADDDGAAAVISLWGASAMLKAKPADVQDKIERLRRQRLADEAARKSAGTWGDRMVGELQHAASGTVYVQVWKGSRRPDLLLGAATRAPQVP